MQEIVTRIPPTNFDAPAPRQRRSRTFKWGYKALECGHKYTSRKFPRTNCTLCWTLFWYENPTHLVGFKEMIDRGERDQLVAHFGEKPVKKAERFIQQNPALFEQKAAE